jgi:hypothetical protein
MTMMPDFAPRKPWQDLTEKLAPLVDAAYKKRKDAEPRREYLGASMMGKECARQVAYEYHGAPKDEGFSGQLYRVFDMGHDGEERVAQYLKIAGFDLRTEGKDGKQFGYCVAGGKMKGHIDGVLVSGPDVMAYPALWENKALNNKGFNELVSKGCKIAKPLYYAQVQIYMAYMGLERCLFTAQNRDTGEVHYEVIDFDAEFAQRMSDRGVKIIQSRNAEEFPRIAHDSTDWRCKWCDYRSRCWTKRETTTDTTTTAPSWLGNGG